MIHDKVRRGIAASLRFRRHDTQLRTDIRRQEMLDKLASVGTRVQFPPPPFFKP